MWLTLTLCFYWTAPQSSMRFDLTSVHLDWALSSSLPGPSLQLPPVHSNPYSAHRHMHPLRHWLGPCWKWTDHWNHNLGPKATTRLSLGFLLTCPWTGYPSSTPDIHVCWWQMAAPEGPWYLLNYQIAPSGARPIWIWSPCPISAGSDCLYLQMGPIHSSRNVPLNHVHQNYALECPSQPLNLRRAFSFIGLQLHGEISHLTKASPMKLSLGMAFFPLSGTGFYSPR